MRRLFAVTVLSLTVVVSASPALAGQGDSAGKVDAEALALVAQARTRLENGAISEGLQLFKRAVEKDPNSGELAQEYGLALAEAGLPDEAVKQLSRAPDLSPSAEATLGLLLAERAQTPKDLEAAVPRLRKGLESRVHLMQTQYALAQALVRLGHGAEAWPHVEALLADRPDDPRILILGGQAKRQAGNLEEAAGLFKRAAAAPEGGQRATIELVDTLSAMGKNKEAAVLLEAFLDKEGATIAGLSRLATLLARAGDRAKALKVVDDVLAKDPNARDALVLKGLLEGGEGHVDVAEKMFRKVLAATPDDADAALALARLLMDARRLGEARTLLDAVWKQLEAAKHVGDDLGADVTYDRIALELTDRKSDQALVWLNKLGKGPYARRALAMWGEYFRQRKAWREGLAWIEKAQVVDQADAKRLRTGLNAEFRFASGDEAGAVAALDPLWSGPEDDVATAVGVLERQKRFAESARRARAALERLKDSTRLRFSLAAALERAGSFDESVAEWRAVIAKDPENASALNYLGYMFADKNVNLDEAKALITKALELEPTSGAFLDSLGWVYFRLGDLDRAEKHLTEAARLEPFDATVHEHLGDLYAARTLKDKAAAEYGRALALEMEETGQKERVQGKLAAVGGATEK